MILYLVLPRKPLTTNHIYGQKRGGGKFIKTEGRKFILEIEMLLRGKTFPYKEDEHYIEIKWHFLLSNFYKKQKKKSINKKSGDMDNFKKLIQDAIARKLGFDDAVICDGGEKKRFYKKDTTVVSLELKSLQDLDLPLDNEIQDLLISL